MRDYRYVCILFVAMFLMPLAVSAASYERNDQIEPLYDVDVWVETRGYNYFGYYCEAGSFLYVDFEVVSGGDIDFYVFNEANFEDWEDDFDAPSMYHYPSCDSYELNITLQYNDYFYIVFVNYDYSVDKHIVGAILRPASTTTTTTPLGNADAAIGILIIAGVGLAAFFGLFYLKFRKNKGVSPVRYGSPSLQHSVDHRTQRRLVGRNSSCPHCGKPGMPLRAKFCPNCSGSLGNSESTMGF